MDGIVENIEAPPGLLAYLEKVIRELPAVDEVWLFGSRAEGLADAGLGPHRVLAGPHRARGRQ